MKKLFSLIIAVLLPLCAAVAEEYALPAFPWERNVSDHWQLDASGIPVHQEPHAIGGIDGRCTVCGCELLDWGDGCIDVIDYDAFGNMLRYTSYENGQATYESTHALTCDESGVVLRDIEFVNGVLTSESIYTIGADGWQIPVTQTGWNDDGTTSVNDFDDHGNLIRTAFYDADGTVSYEELTEYALDDDGWYYAVKITASFNNGVTFITENNQYSDPIRSFHTDENGAITADWTYEYRYENGSKRWARQSFFGVPTWEEYYHEDGSLKKDVEFLDDGGKIVITYGEDGCATHSVTYDAQGNILREEAFAAEED